MNFLSIGLADSYSKDYLLGLADLKGRPLTILLIINCEDIMCKTPIR